MIFKGRYFLRRSLPVCLTVVVLLCSIVSVGEAATHRVASGETLWRIATQHGSTVEQLAATNEIRNPNVIYEGQVLTIPQGTALASRSGRQNTGWQLSQQDIDLMARLVYSEAAGEPYKGQVAVAASVLNRMASTKYPNSIPGVVYQVVNGYYQYSPVLDGRINLPPNQSAYRAVQDALNGWDPSNKALGFFNPRKTSNQWVRSQPVTTVIGNHVFFR